MNWQPDLRTLAVLSSAVVLTLALLTIALWSVERRYRELVQLGIANAAFAALFLNSALLGLTAGPVIIAINALAIALHMVFLKRSVAIFCGRPARGAADWPLVALYALGIVYFSVVAPDLGGRVAIGSLFTAVVSAMAVSILARHRPPEATGPRRVMLIGLGMILFLGIGRPLALAAGAQVSNILQQGVLLAFSYAIWVVAIIAVAGGMVWGVFARAAAELRSQSAALRDSREHLAMAQQVGAFGSARWNLADGSATFSDELYHLLGIADRQSPPSLGLTLTAIHPDDRDRARQWVMAAERGEEIEPWEVRVPRADGSIAWLHCTAQIFRDARGKPAAVVSTYHEITARKNLEAELRRSRDALLNAQRVGRIGSAEVDLRTDKAVWSDELFRIYGLDASRQPASFEACLALVHPDDRQMLVDDREAKRTGGEWRAIEYRITRSDGQIRWIHEDQDVLRDAAGAPMVLYTTQQDITERKRMEEELLREHESLTAAQRIGRVGCLEIDLVTDTANWSDELYRIFGIEPARKPGSFREFLELVHPEDRSLVSDSRAGDWSGDGVHGFEYRIVRPNGQLRWIHEDREIRCDAKGAPVKVLCVRQDITVRKMLEDEVVRSRDGLMVAQRIGRMGSAEIDFATERAVWSEEMFRIYGIDPSRQPITFEDYLLLVHPEDRQRHRDDRDQSLRGVHIGSREFRILRPDGGIRWVLEDREVRRDAKGNPVTVLVTNLDITERRRLQDAMLREHERMLTAQRIGRLGSAEVDLKTQTAIWSEELFRIYGIEPADQPNSLEAFLALVHPDDRARLAEIRARNLDGEGLEPVEYRIVRGDGEVRWIYQDHDLRRDSSGAPATLFATQQDITERIRMEEELRQSGDKMAEILAALNFASCSVIVSDADWRIVYTNDTAIEMLGLPTEPDAVLGKTLADLQADNPSYSSHVGTARTALDVVDHWEGTLPWRRLNDGGILYLDARRHRLPNGGFVSVSIDVTKRVQLEEEERRHREREAQTAKIEALGNLAGGIAHDFNNLLGAVLGFAQFLMQDLPVGSDQYRFAERIVGVSERGRSLVRQILAFSRRTVIEEADILLREAVTETRDMLRATLPSTTEIAVENDGGDAAIHADKGQLVQVLVNLCVNGSDALEGKPGHIAISISRPDRGRADLRRLPACAAKPAPGASEHWIDETGAGHIITGGMPMDDCIVLAVADNGSGIPKAMLGKILEPFVTTKEKGKGTGLGLAVVHRIVIEYGGAMVVTTREGEGTRFEIILPLSAPREQAVPRHAEDAKAAASASAPSSILVVDDDEAYLAMVETALTRVGYRVQSTNDPRQALDWARAGRKWDVLVSDQTMPHVRGSDLVHSFKTHNQASVCIICTGFSSGLNEQQAVTAGADAFMLKPYNVADLASLVARLLAQKAEAGAALTGA